MSARPGTRSPRQQREVMRMATQKDENLLTAAALAKKLKVAPEVVQKALEEAGAKPVKVRCGRSYYSEKDAAAVEAQLKK